MNIFERAKAALLVFRGRDRSVRDWTSEENWGNGVQSTQFTPGYGGGYNGPGLSPINASRPDQVRLSPVNAETIVASVQNRIALDVAMVEFHHAVINENDDFVEAVPGRLEDAMTIEANIDQSSFMYMHDLVISMMNEPDGVVAEVAVSSDKKENKDGDLEFTNEEPIQLRTGRITKWSSQKVEVELLNEETQKHEKVWLDKREVSIIENPFRMIMNDKKGLQARLTRKMALLDKIDENLGSDRMNIIIQLPYVVRNDIKRTEARARLKEMEDQLKASQLGITYVDGTEKVIQLNRPLGEGLQSQIEWMTELYLSQLCITKEILNGTADAKVMANYQQRCIGVYASVIVQERRRKFLSYAQRLNRESIVFVQDPFKLIPVTELADLMDKSIRGAIMSPNDWRSIIGYKPSNDASANMLVNRNMPMDQTPGGAETTDVDQTVPEQPAMPPGLQHGSVPLNRQQRRQQERSKVPRNKSG